jgi:3-methylcrotonyl-CoA carboxylase alpha subunit
MEMNTRLQVEHPVTEAVTGLDLVEQQFRVAAGFPLGFGQEDIRLHGHAIEVRLCAENPVRNYLPSPGVLADFDLPGPPARVDTGLRAGDRVTPWYDNLLAKVIVHGADRDAALADLAAALEVTRISGLAVNLDLLRAVAVHPAFQRGEVHTDFLAEHASVLLAPRLSG